MLKSMKIFKSSRKIFVPSASPAKVKYLKTFPIWKVTIKMSILKYYDIFFYLLQTSVALHDIFTKTFLFILQLHFLEKELIQLSKLIFDNF